jgi:hypothetical protein
MKQRAEYSSDKYDLYLEQGESVPSIVGKIIDLEEDSSRIVPIRDVNGVEGQSVFLDMAPDGYVSPVEIVDPEVTFSVSTMEGAGTLFVQKIGTDIVRRVRLRPGIVYTLEGGDAYGYVPKGANGWVVRDDGNVPFEPEMEGAVTTNTANTEGGRVLRSIQRAHRVRNS